MRGLLRLLGAVTILFLVVVVLTATVSFIRHTWFSSSNYTGITSSKRIAVVELKGMILTSATFVKDIKEAKEDSGVKAIVVRINSPGGLVAPSQEMYNAIVDADSKKPVVISMAALAASGGYYAALGGRKIYANPGTLTASIGVIMEFLNLEKLYQWAKVSRFTITAGKMKDAGSPLKPMGPEEKAMFQAMLNDIHVQFRQAVKERRKIDSPTLEAITDGRVMTGNQAFQAKLVDELGGMEQALAEAKKLGGLSADAPVEYPSHPKGFLREMMLGEENEGGSDSKFWNLAQAFFLSRLFTAETPALTEISPGWHVMLKAPVQ